MEKISIHTIVMHHRPHWDEIIALYLLRNYPEAEDRFPGVTKAQLAFWKGAGTLDGKNGDDWEKRGFLLLGRGGGRFDEHATVYGPRKEGMCCATLVAEELGITQYAELTQLLEETQSEDLNAGKGILGIPYVIKLMHAQSPNDPEETISWALDAATALVEEQRWFFKRTGTDFKQNSRRMVAGKRRGKDVTIAVIESDDERISKYARSKFGDYTAVVIQKNSSGNTQILTNNFYQLNMNDAVRMLRLSEQRRRGTVVETNWDELEKEGSIPAVPMWYYQKHGEMILNGSLTAPDVEPTALSLEAVAEIVRIALDERVFPETRAEKCHSGVCTHSSDNPCPFYDFGLTRCREIRALRSRS